TIPGVIEVAKRVWSCGQALIDVSTRYVGPVWIGAGRAIPTGATVLGPAALWDSPEARPSVTPLRWHQIEPTAQESPAHAQSGRKQYHQPGKRIFDIVFAALALLFTLPLYPF